MKNINIREKINEFNAIARAFRAAMELSEAIEEYMDGEAELGNHQASLNAIKADIERKHDEQALVFAELIETREQLASAQENLADAESRSATVADEAVAEATKKADSIIADAVAEANGIIESAKIAVQASNDKIAEAQKDLVIDVDRLRELRSELNAEFDSARAELAETRLQIEKNNARIAAYIEASKL